MLQCVPTNLTLGQPVHVYIDQEHVHNSMYLFGLISVYKTLLFMICSILTITYYLLFVYKGVHKCVHRTRVYKVFFVHSTCLVLSEFNDIVLFLVIFCMK